MTDTDCDPEDDAMQLLLLSRSGREAVRPHVARIARNLEMPARRTMGLLADEARRRFARAQWN